MVTNYHSLKLVIVFIILFSSLAISAPTDAQKEMLENLPPDQRGSILLKMEKSSNLTDEINEAFGEEKTLIARPDQGTDIDSQEECPKCIFGYDFFQFSPSTFAPINNIPISSNYVLGPGDKLVINLYGNQEDKVEAFISRSGEIILFELGPVNLLGMTFDEATNFIKNKVSKELIGTQVSVNLKELRSISVYLLGEAYKPGQYTMSGLSTVTNALFVAGGVSEDGSLRNIEIKRGNKTIATYDFYEFLLKGTLDSDLRLQDGDVIFIPFIKHKIRIGGSFRRPHNYEILQGQSIQDAIDLAGGPTSDVLKSTKIELTSFNADLNEREVFLISPDSPLLEERILKNGDTVNISSSSITKTQSFKISGEVLRPGEYAILPGDTILDLINRAGGYTKDSYSEGAIFLRKEVAKQQKKGYLRSADQLETAIANAILYNDDVELDEFSLVPVSKIITRLREEEPIGRMVVNVDYLSLKTDPYSNFVLQDGDSLHVPKRPNHVSVVGEVLNSATLLFDVNLSLRDYINQAGGANEAADSDNIFVILPNGRSEIAKKTLFNRGINILPGTTVVVSRDTKSYDAIAITRIITPILADLATSAAAIAAISD